jgi:hypothetical protein
MSMHHSRDYCHSLFPIYFNMCRGLSAPLSDTYVLLYLAFLFNHVHDPLTSGLVPRCSNP